MREMFIKYNPYRLETVVLVDGEAPEASSRLNCGERRLQEWVEDLPDIVWEEFQTRRFKIVFHGATLDFEDVEAMAGEAKEREFEIELEYVPAKEVADKERAIAEIFDDIQAGPFDELKEPDVVRAFEMALSDDFEVDVIATMKAGKSTLINSLLGQKLMPAKNDACTARITEIKDNGAEIFTAKAYDAQNALMEECSELTLEVMERLNANPDLWKICAEGNIPFVSADDVSLVLVDTPGPNNSRDLSHQAATYRMLSESSKALVLYILNAQQLAVNDDVALLSKVAESMSVGGKVSRDRFLFVVSKLDTFKKKTDNVDTTLADVRVYLKRFGIENPNIYPVSAQTALDIRTILAESDDEDDDEVYEAKGLVRKFSKPKEKKETEYYFETRAPLTPSVRKELEARLKEAEDNKDAKGQALVHCGIVPLEMGIRTYLRKYAKTAKIKNIVDVFSKRLESAKSFETTKREIAENRDKHREIIARIELIESKLESVDEGKRFKERIDKINYDAKIKEIADKKIQKAQARITDKLMSASSRMTESEAKEACKRFREFTDDLRAELQAELEDLITNHVTQNANDLLEEYRAKIRDLSQDVEVGGVDIDPFAIMEGSISGVDVLSIINASEKTEQRREVVGRHKEYKEWIGARRACNNIFGCLVAVLSLGTELDAELFEVEEVWVDDYEWVDHTYIDGEALAQRFFAPVQEGLYKYKNNAIEYAKAAAEKIKEEFEKKFDELNKLLMKKLQELKDCTKDGEDVERQILESERKLEWLAEIQARVDAILDM